MTDTKTFVDRALAHDLVTHCVEVQIMNLAGTRPPEHVRKALEQELLAYARDVAEAALRGQVPKPDAKSIRAAVYANQVAACLKKQGGERLRREAVDQLTDKGLPDIRLPIADMAFYKLSMNASQTVWMLRHGLDPDLLRLD